MTGLHARETEEDRGLRIRARLFRADPHCFWCGVEVVMDRSYQQQPNFATVDHLYSRWHPERKARHSNNKGVLHVLACADCNAARAGCECQSQPFIPKLPERLEFAQLADATLARRKQFERRKIEARPVTESVVTEPRPAQVLSLREETLVHQRAALTRRTIRTLQEAVEYAKNNPGR